MESKQQCSRRISCYKEKESSVTAYAQSVWSRVVVAVLSLVSLLALLAFSNLVRLLKTILFGLFVFFFLSLLCVLLSRLEYGVGETVLGSGKSNPSPFLISSAGVQPFSLRNCKEFILYWGTL